MKKQLSLTLLAILGAGSMSFWLFMEAQAQIDFFTFYIPYRADDLRDIFNLNTNFQLDAQGEAITTTISISVYRDNTIIYYDHWEDGGLEPNPTKPRQPETQVWGDNNLANGFINNPDILSAGEVVTLQNQIVVVPRDSSDIVFDGGDKLTAVGGPLAVTLADWPFNKTPPSTPLPQVGILFAGAWELFPTNKWGVEYQIPIGENLAPQRSGFDKVIVNVQAVEDNTTVTFDPVSGPAQNVVLDQGQNFIQMGQVDVGDRISATAPIQVHAFALDSRAQYEARAYTILPFDQWTDQLLAPRSSDGDFWLYNPHPNPLDVKVRTSTTTKIITIPPISTTKYPAASLSSATGAHFASTTGQKFYGVAALDASDRRDWGYALLPFETLTTQGFVGWGVGNNNDPPAPGNGGDGFESHLYVTALSTTTVHVDFENDGTVDQSFPVFPLTETPITSPTRFDLSGAFLYTENNVPFAAAWGQSEEAPSTLPSIDVGTNIVPFPSLLIQKTITSYAKETACSEPASGRNTIQYQLQYFNLSANSIGNVIITDLLSPQQTYVPNTTTLNDQPIADDSNGITPFPLDEDGLNIGDLPSTGLNKGNTLTFDAAIPAAGANTISNTAAIKSLDAANITDLALIFTPILAETDPIYKVDAALIDPAEGPARSGDVITYNLTITNTGSLTITSFPLRYTFDGTYLTFRSSPTPPTAVAGGLINWADLTAAFGDLSPGQVISLTASFDVNDIQTGIEVTNKMVGAGGEINNVVNSPTCSDEAVVRLEPSLRPTEPPTGTPTPSATRLPPPETATPTPEPPPSPPPDSDDNDGGDDDADESDIPVVKTPMTAGGTPLAKLPIEPPDLPVTVLPETGSNASFSYRPWLLALSLLFGFGFWWAMRRSSPRS